MRASGSVRAEGGPVAMLVAAAIAAGCTPGPAEAFEKWKHVEFAFDGLALFKNCTQTAVSGEASRAFAEGARVEDHLWPSRIRNWHFYDARGEVGTYWCVLLRCKGSNERIFARRVRELVEAIDDGEDAEEVLEAAGRVAHHVQDMASPPHVAPIYHLANDRFDRYRPTVVSSLAGADLCAAVREGAGSFEGLLAGAAGETERAIGAQVEFASGTPVEGETWARFFGGGPDPDRQGFRTYGSYGNDFGVVLPWSPSPRGRYDEETFRAFFDGRRRQAAIDSARVLLLVDALVKRREARPAAAPCLALSAAQGPPHADPGGSGHEGGAANELVQCAARGVPGPDQPRATCALEAGGVLAR